MKVIRTVKEMQGVCLKLKARGKSIGLVPTMGALHEGHLSLVARARKANDIVVVSLFVNPTQFGPNEDYLRYPRPFNKDKELCKKAGVNYLFAPSVNEMYPEGYLTYVQVEKMSALLCGAFRPGHFRGVTTVVAKLFNIVQPDNAYFGRKDYQQLKIIERMASDLNLPVTIVGCPIVREESGLARSSRNQYLSEQERESASRIYRSLQAGKELTEKKNIHSSRRILQKVTSMINEIPGAKIDYVCVCDADTLEPVPAVKHPVVIAVAVWVGKTRLIDNMLAGVK